eukprot:TRINITY_DN15136_c0_g1_i1.p2 TRINITY_DN15136_c0_g1~~TRINITY_DN15136_c0_g1_i1.p2  ORF type:complete len:137 (+),score=55.35 TRINITY_DN15136_c0_g1_i1:23-412(+)
MLGTTDPAVFGSPQRNVKLHLAVLGFTLVMVTTAAILNTKPPKSPEELAQAQRLRTTARAAAADRMAAAADAAKVATDAEAEGAAPTAFRLPLTAAHRRWVYALTALTLVAVGAYRVVLGRRKSPLRKE